MMTMMMMMMTRTLLLLPGLLLMSSKSIINKRNCVLQLTEKRCHNADPSPPVPGLRFFPIAIRATSFNRMKATRAAYWIALSSVHFLVHVWPKGLQQLMGEILKVLTLKVLLKQKPEVRHDKSFGRPTKLFVYELIAGKCSRPIKWVFISAIPDRI